MTPEGTSFRLWAPDRRRVSVVLEISGEEHPLEPAGSGYFEGLLPLPHGTRYRLRLDGGADLYPDPASRSQPMGPDGPSEVIDLDRFSWSDRHWKGRSLKGAVISEIHIGTFTQEGSFRAAAEQLAALAEMGINTIEVMPVNDFPGRFGWGYDGVGLWAPVHIYGTPYDFMTLVDAAHNLRMAVILDVVYNHLGPDGCHLSQFARSYFTDKYANEWGQAINFDGPQSEGVREFFSENAAYWIEQFHLDGLRIDATQSMYDQGDPHILRLIAAKARQASGGRSIILLGENEPQQVSMVEKHGLDALWNDDWHHASVVALTGRAEAYYTDYTGAPQEFVSMSRLGFLYQGQHYRWQGKRRGTPSWHLPPESLVIYLENHDQLANSGRGNRLRERTSPGRWRAMTALLLLSPQTPMLFQGQEFGATAPFRYFADHRPELAASVERGRRAFLSQFPSLAAPEMQEQLPAPHDEQQSFRACKLDHSERERHGDITALHRDLLSLRRQDPTFSAQDVLPLHGAVLSDRAFLLRWLYGDDRDRLLLINQGPDLHLDPLAQPLLAAPQERRWEIRWSSESPEYGGSGVSAMEMESGWRIPGEAAVVLDPKR